MPLKIYIVVNFKTCRISWDARKLTRTPILIKKIKLYSHGPNTLDMILGNV